MPPGLNMNSFGNKLNKKVETTERNGDNELFTNSERLHMSDIEKIKKAR